MRPGMHVTIAAWLPVVALSLAFWGLFVVLPVLLFSGRL